MQVTRRQALPSLVAIAAVCVAAAGCGGDDTSEGSDGADAGTSTATATVPSGPPAKGSPEEFATRTAKLVASTKAKKGCAPLDAINQRSSFKFTCPPAKDVRDSLAVFEIVKSARHGTAAVIDYRTGKSPSGATMLVYKTPAGRWSIGRFGIINFSVDREPDTESRPGFDKAVAGYLKAVRERDCEGFGATAMTGTQDEKVYCRREFTASEPLAKTLKANPDAKADYLGGDAKLGFYALRTRKPKPGYYTITLVEVDPKAVNRYKVLDVVSGPPDG